MIKHIFSFKKIFGWIDPLPEDFGSMYFLYPSEDRHAGGFKVAGLGMKIFEKAAALLPKKDPVRYFRPKKIY